MADSMQNRFLKQCERFIRLHIFGKKKTRQSLREQRALLKSKRIDRKLFKQNREFPEGLKIAREICKSPLASPDDYLERTWFLHQVGKHTAIHRYVRWLTNRADIPSVDLALRLYGTGRPASAIKALGPPENWNDSKVSAEVAFLSLVRQRILRGAADFAASSDKLPRKSSNIKRVHRTVSLLESYGIDIRPDQDVSYALLEHWLRKLVETPPPAYTPQTGRVLVYSHSIAVGGAERQVMYLLKGLIKDPSVSALDLVIRRLEETDYDLGIEADHFSIHDLNKTSDLLPEPWKDHELLRQIKDMHNSGHYYSLFKLLSIIYSLKPEVIHVRGGLHGEIALAGLLAGVPKVVVQFGSMTRGQQSAGSEIEFQKETLIEHIIGRASAWPQVALAANSRAAADDWANACGIPKDRFQVIHNSIQPDELGFTPPAPFDHDPGRPLVVGGVFRLAPVKDPLLWVAVARKVLDAKPDTRFLIVGNGPMRGAVERAIDAAGITEAFEMPGLVKNGMFDYLRRMDLSLMTTRTESLPNAVIEAQLAGLGVVAPDVGGISEAAANPEMVKLATSRDADELAELVIQGLDDVEWRRAVYEHAPDIVCKKFSQEALVASAKAAYGWSDR